MVKVHRVDVSAEPGYIDISAYSGGSAVSKSTNMHLPPDTELCFNDDGNQVSPGSPDCKLDIYLEEIDTTVDPYKPKIIKGCYNK